MHVFSNKKGAFLAALSQLRRRNAALLTFVLMLTVFAAHSVQAKPKTTNINVIPTITSISNQGGQLVASGYATAVIHGKQATAPFTAPVAISPSPDQSAAAAAGCPILDLSLGPINLDLLGLVVQTSPICLKVTAYAGGGLLGDLLCQVANLLNGGLSLNQILSGLGLPLLPGLSSGQVTSLLSGLTNLLNSALSQLAGSVLTGITNVNTQHTCSILNLQLGPLALNLLGLNVYLDNCANGPVTVSITAQTGQGNLLGNLLCGLLDGGLINLQSTFQQIEQQIVGLLTA